MKQAVRHVRRSLIFLVGILILVTGVVLIPLPGPGIGISIIGLAILASEFIWAQDLLDKARAKYRTTIEAKLRKFNEARNTK